MATSPPESSPVSPEPDSSQDYEVVSYYIERQKDNPEYWDKLADKLWAELSPEERTVRTVLSASFFPDDMGGRELSIKVELLSNHIREQIALTRLFNQDLGLEADQASVPPAELE